MKGETQIDAVDRLTKRHIAKLLARLDDIAVAGIVKDEVKRHFWFFSKDIIEQVINK